MWRHGSVVRSTMYLANMDIKTAFDEARPRHVGKIFFRMRGEQLLVRSVSPPWKRRSSQIVAKMATQLQANVEETWTRKRIGIRLDLERQRAHQMRSFMWADNFWIMSHSESHLEQMLQDLIEEAEKWDLHPKLASLWWTSTNEPEEKPDLSIDAKSGRHGFPFRENFKILGCAMNRHGKAHGGIEERMQSTNKGEMSRYTEAKKCRGESSLEEWWNTSIASSLLGVEIGPGTKKLSTESKDGRRRR